MIGQFLISADFSEKDCCNLRKQDKDRNIFYVAISKCCRGVPKWNLDKLHAILVPLTCKHARILSRSSTVHLDRPKLRASDDEVNESNDVANKQLQF